MLLQVHYGVLESLVEKVAALVLAVVACLSAEEVEVVLGDLFVVELECEERMKV